MVARIARLIITAINDPVISQGAKVGVGASVGIAIFPQDGDTPASLLANADTAMSAAKKSGKNSFCFFDSAMPCQES